MGNAAKSTKTVNLVLFHNHSPSELEICMNVETFLKFQLLWSWGILKILQDYEVLFLIPVVSIHFYVWLWPVHGFVIR